MEQQEEADGLNEQKATGDSYASRMLACTRCHAWQETKWKQLRTKEGFRAIHCKACGKQERTSANICQCGNVWHECPTHREEPSTHHSKKGVVKKDTKVEPKEKTSVYLEKPRNRRRRRHQRFQQSCEDKKGRRRDANHQAHQVRCEQEPAKAGAA